MNEWEFTKKKKRYFYTVSTPFGDLSGIKNSQKKNKKKKNLKNKRKIKRKIIGKQKENKKKKNVKKQKKNKKKKQKKNKREEKILYKQIPRLDMSLGEGVKGVARSNHDPRDVGRRRPTRRRRPTTPPVVGHRDVDSTPSLAFQVKMDPGSFDGPQGKALG